MNLQDVQKQREHQKAVVADVLKSYLQTHACPCAWPQFEYWVGKQRPPRSQDSIQNDLVEAALHLPIYTRIPPAKPAYWLEADFHCAVCGTHWNHFSEEWHMLAYHETLLRADGHTPDLFLIKTILKKSGFSPAQLESDLSTLRLPLDQWHEFMLADSKQGIV